VAIVTGRPLIAFIASLESSRGVVLLVCTFLLSLAISVVQNPLIQVFEGYQPRFFASLAMFFAALIPLALKFGAYRVWIVAAWLACIAVLCLLGHTRLREAVAAEMLPE
jgi:hypothetical protein